MKTHTLTHAQAGIVLLALAFLLLPGLLPGDLRAQEVPPDQAPRFLPFATIGGGAGPTYYAAGLRRGALEIGVEYNALGSPPEQGVRNVFANTGDPSDHGGIIMATLGISDARPGSRVSGRLAVGVGRASIDRYEWANCSNESSWLVGNYRRCETGDAPGVDGGLAAMLRAGLMTRVVGPLGLGVSGMVMTYDSEFVTGFRSLWSFGDDARRGRSKDP